MAFRPEIFEFKLDTKFQEDGTTENILKLITKNHDRRQSEFNIFFNFFLSRNIELRCKFHFDTEFQVNWTIGNILKIFTKLHLSKLNESL